MSVFLDAFANVNGLFILSLFFGVIAGYVIGALPGFTATMGVALFIPFSYRMDVNVAFAFLIALYCSAVFAGSIPAIMIRTPGTPAAICTILDGYPMAKKGQAGKALGLACLASVFGGLVSTVFLIFMAGPIARGALRFGPHEYFALTLLGLSLVVGMSSDNIIKGFIAACIGLLVTIPGMDALAGFPRFTFRRMELLSGIQELPVIIGIFALSEVFFGFQDSDREPAGKQKITGLLSGLEDIKDNWKLLIRTSLWGTFLGALPGVGATTAAIIGYDEAKRSSKHKEQMGTGQPEGIIGPECANNAVTGGALIPMLALGIPGDPVTAVLLGGLMVHGLRPGPELFRNSPQVVYGMYISIVVSYLIILALSLFSIKFIARLLNVKSSIMSAFVLVLSVIGAYALQNSYFDVFVMIVFGLVGFFMRKHGFELGPFTLAFVLGRLIESKLGLAILLSRGNLLSFFTRPISCVLLISTFLFIIISIWRIRRKQVPKEA